MRAACRCRSDSWPRPSPNLRGKGLTRWLVSGRPRVDLGGPARRPDRALRVTYPAAVWTQPPLLRRNDR